MTSQSGRRQTLLELVMSEDFDTQEALQSALEARGCSTTQSSISRDIKALGLEKRAGVYVASREILAGPGGLKVWQAVTEVLDAGPHMVVVRCLAAMAQAIAAAIDDASWPGVAGTVAGDDTLFLALTSDAVQSSLMRRVRILAELDD